MFIHEVFSIRNYQSQNNALSFVIYLAPKFLKSLSRFLVSQTFSFALTNKLNSDIKQVCRFAIQLLLTSLCLFLVLSADEEG